MAPFARLKRPHEACSSDPACRSCRADVALEHALACSRMVSRAQALGRVPGGPCRARQAAPAPTTPRVPFFFRPLGRSPHPLRSTPQGDGPWHSPRSGSARASGRFRPHRREGPGAAPRSARATASSLRGRRRPRPEWSVRLVAAGSTRRRADARRRGLRRGSATAGPPSRRPRDTRRGRGRT